MRRIQRLIAVHAALVCVLAGVVACSSISDEPVGQLLDSWNEDDEAWVADAVPLPLIFRAVYDVQRWLSTLPADSAVADSVQDVDFSSDILVIGSYDRCTETSAVYIEELDDERAMVRFAVQREATPEVCARTYRVIDAWTVSLEDLPDATVVGASMGPVSDDGAEVLQVGEMLGTANVGDLGTNGSEALTDIAQNYPVVTTGQDRDALVEELGAALSPDAQVLLALDEVNMDASALVVAGYAKCSEQSAVYAESSRSPVPVWVELSFEPVDCASAPFTLDIWEVPYDQVGADGEPNGLVSAQDGNYWAAKFER